MVDFWEFVDGQLSAEIYGLIVANTVKTPVPEQVPVKSASLADKHIYLTGVRDKDVEDLIVKHGGTVQSTFTASTNMLVRKNAEYTNKKTEDAEKKGIPIFTLEELKSSIVGLR
jgi:NAD-dependent DNA ligase